MLWCPLRFLHGSSIPPVVCKSAHVFFMLVVFACVEWCPTHIVFCLSFVFLRRVTSFSVKAIADNLTIKWDLPITPQMKMNCCCHVFIMTLMSRATNDVQECINIDKDLQTKQDISDVNIIILIYLFIKHVLFILMYLYKCKMHVSLELKVYLFI